MAVMKETRDESMRYKTVHRDMYKGRRGRLKRKK